MASGFRLRHMQIDKESSSVFEHLTELFVCVQAKALCEPNRLPFTCTGMFSVWEAESFTMAYCVLSPLPS